MILIVVQELLQAIFTWDAIIVIVIIMLVSEGLVSRKILYTPFLLHYIAVSLSVSIGVVSVRERTFNVTCTATGGTLSTSSLTGPGLGGGDLQLQAEGGIGRTGQNTYSVTSDTLLGQSNGENYTCKVMRNNVSVTASSTVLAGIMIRSLTHYVTL